MANNSAIEWTDATWNPIAGCTPVSPSCTHCYAATMARRLEAMGQTKYVGTAERRGAAAGVTMDAVAAMNHAASGAPVRVGKKAAGRLLDGELWNEFPQPTGVSK